MFVQQFVYIFIDLLQVSVIVILFSFLNLLRIDKMFPPDVAYVRHLDGQGRVLSLVSQVLSVGGPEPNVQTENTGYSNFIIYHFIII